MAGQMPGLRLVGGRRLLGRKGTGWPKRRDKNNDEPASRVHGRLLRRGSERETIARASRAGTEVRDMCDDSGPRELSNNFAHRLNEPTVDPKEHKGHKEHKERNS